jgi:hypothetical protein
MIVSIDVVEMIHFADDRLETKFGLIEKLVPIECVNDAHVTLSQFDEFLLQFTLNSGDTTALEIGQVLWDDFGRKSGDRVG